MVERSTRACWHRSRDKGELETSYGASQFALIVTAEPHFAVGTPSDMITLYNVADDVEGEESKVTTLVERNDYSALAVVPVGEDPLELAQARYAVAIAKQRARTASLRNSTPVRRRA